jgi:hypothetical protein
MKHNLRNVNVTAGLKRFLLRWLNYRENMIYENDCLLLYLQFV